MSKLWLLLLAVAAFQAVHSYPAYEAEYLEDADQSTWGILKDTFGKLKDIYTDKGKEALAKLTEKLKEKLCNQQDFEEDFDFEEDEEPSVQLQVVQKLRELLKKLQDAAGAEKVKIQAQIDDLRAKICAKLSDVEVEDFEEDDELSWDMDEDFLSMEEDKAETTADIIKDSWKKLKDLWKKNTENAKGKAQDKLQKLIAKLKDTLCKQKDFLELDYEEDADSDSLKTKLMQKIKELQQKVKKVTEEKKLELLQRIEELRVKICDRLSDVEVEDAEEDDELSWDMFDEFVSMEEDKAETTADIIKDSWKKLKDLWKKNTENAKGKAQDKLQKLVAKLKDTLCKQKDFLELDYEEDADSDSLKTKLMTKIKELQQKIKKVTQEKKLELLQRIEELRVKICDKLSDVEVEDTDDGDDEERIKWGKLGSKLGKGLKKAWKKLKPALKNGIKKGAKMLKSASVKVTPFECEEKTCRTCIRLTVLDLSACLKATITRTNKNTYFTIAGELNGKQTFEEKIRLGDMPRCVNAGGVIGKICLKGMEGKGKSSQGQAHVNFCLGILAEQHNVGLKVCATYENKKFKIKLSPQLFAGGLDDDGDIVVADEKDESQGVVFDADEFEID